MVAERIHVLRKLEAECDGLRAELAATQNELSTACARSVYYQRELKATSGALSEERQRFDHLSPKTEELAQLNRRADDLKSQLREDRARGKRLLSQLQKPPGRRRGRGRGRGRGASLPPRPSNWLLTDPPSNESRGGVAGDAAPGWSRTRDRLSRELDELRAWRAHTESSVERMSDALRSVESRCEQQSRYGQELEAAMARLGRQAQSTCTGGGCAWPDLVTANGPPGACPCGAALSEHASFCHVCGLRRPSPSEAHF